MQDETAHEFQELAVLRSTLKVNYYYNKFDMNEPNKIPFYFYRFEFYECEYASVFYAYLNLNDVKQAFSLQRDFLPYLYEVETIDKNYDFSLTHWSHELHNSQVVNLIQI